MFEELTFFTARSEPCIFFISFDKKRIHVFSPNDAKRKGIFFIHSHDQRVSHRFYDLKPEFICFDLYKRKFEQVMFHIRRGDTYLLNLTLRTKITLPYSLDELSEKVTGKFVGFWPHKFLFFSPEPFVIIDRDNFIHTFPMKGTSHSKIDVDGNLLLTKEKESREHATVVDLLRNDLAMVSGDITVEKYKYLEKIHLSDGNFLWQMSSHIKGKLPPDWKFKAGEILYTLLPGGSISGAPKKKTLEIIQEVEEYDREFYTGIAGFFDGKELISTVMIRYIGFVDGNYFYYSGGGISSLSVAEEEYEEYKKKIYLPLKV
ncbi:MAG: aminodeoxychorismate synthase component I [Bacteroidales bacterium]|nr:aminodeoxychorismate synthase component I [Bacteroidales bacterium]